MRFSFAAIAQVALLTQTVIATPVSTEVSTIVGPLPLAELDASSLGSPSVALPPSTLRPSVGPHPDEIDIVLLLCRASGCQNCDLVDLMGLNADACFAENFQFVSAAVIQPNADSLPFNTTVCTAGCTQCLALPDINTCFNVAGSTFAAFALLI
ncbi:hypothetical protein TRAPUB_531 [Trametes pubescens]|uniref:Hydrophobin n=1 Tax=Trametes pubescens TaxID=154538 RepID=A0A1M2VLX3_TRAPU|nr:hypothetical protein TRAPUB_531 [Trametes pubescens]